MKIPKSPQAYDPLRQRREYPVGRIRSVQVDEDATLVIEFDCLDDGSNVKVPGIEHQPTCAVLGMSRANAHRLVRLLNAALTIDATNEAT
jgi:hypothetical protein